MNMFDYFDLTPDKQRFFFDEETGIFNCELEGKKKFKLNKNFYPRDKVLFSLDKPSKEINIMIYWALFSDEHNTVLTDKNVFSEGFRFVDINNTDEVDEVFDNMLKYGIVAIMPTLEKYYRIIFNPTLVTFVGSLFERDRLFFASMHFREMKEMANEKKSEKQEYVYLMKGFETYTKIGRSTNVKGRVSSHACSNPNTELLFCIESDGSTEGRLHKHFRDKRVKLEWFDLTDSDIEWIKSNFKVVECIEKGKNDT